MLDKIVIKALFFPKELEEGPLSGPHLLVMVKSIFHPPLRNVIKLLFGPRMLTFTYIKFSQSLKVISLTYYGDLNIIICV